MSARSQRVRRLMWDGCLNVRDLGGFPAMDGRETRWGAVVRSDNPGRLTGAGREALLAYGIRTIVDLRFPHELEEYPHPFAEPGEHGIFYTHRPFIRPGAPSPPNLDELSLSENYINMLDRFAPEVSAIVQTIATAPEGGVLVHCAAGKDRTGITSAILLDLVGVDRATIAADYALTAECLEPEMTAWLLNGPGTRDEREQILARNRPRAEVMLQVLDHLDSRYGGAEPYLLHGAMDASTLARIRERLLSDDAG